MKVLPLEITLSPEGASEDAPGSHESPDGSLFFSLKDEMWSVGSLLSSVLTEMYIVMFDILIQVLRQFLML